MSTNLSKPFVIYDHRIRWVATVIMAFIVAGIWLILRFGSGYSRYIPVVFLALFSLIWIRDLLFGIRVMLLSDGFTLSWQDGKAIGSVPLARIYEKFSLAHRPLGLGITSWDGHISGLN